MAGNGGHDGPSMLLVRYVFDNHWTIDALETYVVQYQPEGLLLHTLRRGLGYHSTPFPVYAHTLVRFATVLVALGHTRSPARVLLEFTLFQCLPRLTQTEVTSRDTRYLVKKREKMGGGGYSFDSSFNFRCSHKPFV